MGMPSHFMVPVTSYAFIATLHNFADRIIPCFGVVAEEKTQPNILSRKDPSFKDMEDDIVITCRSNFNNTKRMLSKDDDRTLRVVWVCYFNLDVRSWCKYALEETLRDLTPLKNIIDGKEGMPPRVDAAREESEPVIGFWKRTIRTRKYLILDRIGAQRARDPI